jgi:hypothetical protein
MKYQERLNYHNSYEVPMDEIIKVGNNAMEIDLPIKSL